MQIWDLPAKEFNFMGGSFLRNSTACILIFDLTSTETFQKLEYFRKECLKFLNPNNPNEYPFILFGNKNDLNNVILVSQEEIDTYCKEHNNMPYFSISAKNGTNLDKAFDKVAEMALQNEEKELKIEQNENKKEQKDKKQDININKKNLQKNINKNLIKDIYFENNEEDNLIISLSKDYDYFCEINFDDLKNKYKILKSVKNKENFIALLKRLKEKNKIYISLYLPNILKQISVILTSLLGDEEIITFELKYKNFEEEMPKVLIKELVKLNKNKFKKKESEGEKI